MSIVSIDGEMFRKMILSGASALNERKSEVDALNVFPVPDGDTGTNMSLTFLAAAKEANKLTEPGVYEVAKAVSGGSLRGARGNSGVILSQLFRGFAKGLEGCVTANIDDMANAFIKASEMAYKAVMKPKEGTILTIARSMAEKAADMAFETDEIDVFLLEIIKYAREILDKTTEMLPALKQAGVVDAGGYGLLCIWEAALAAISDKQQQITVDFKPSQIDISKTQVFSSITSEDIEFGYCTEFFINIDNANEKIEDELKKYLSTIGDSIVAVADGNIIKIHVHTNNPGAVLEKALSIGHLDNIKIENMRIQHTNKINFEEEKPYGGDNGAYESGFGEAQENKEVGFIVVSSGAGFRELFTGLGADIVVEGGQTMNPSTEDFMSAIEKLNADNIIIMPNNKNIILAAEQAAELIEDKKIFVISTKSIPQGVSALINYSYISSVEENVEEMKEIIKNVITGQITYAVRTTTVDDTFINEGDILCMKDGKIIHTSKDVQQGAKELLDMLLEQDGEVLSIFYGESVTDDMAEDLLQYVSENYPDIETDLHNGGQPVYQYIFSIE